MKIEDCDEWQKDFIHYKGHKVLVSGRQTGKSEAAAIDNGEEAVKIPNSVCLIISKTERQAEELLIKTLRYVGDNYKKLIKKGKDRPTKSKFQLINGSVVLSYPVGLAGEGVRFLTITKLTVDEAQLPPDDVYTAITPMLLTTGGKISLLGTPQGKRGYFWEAYKNELNQFKVFHVNSEKVINERPISETWPQWRKDAALNHLAQEKLRMTSKQYAQEYLGEFVEDLLNFFPEEILDKILTLKRDYVYRGKGYLGVDVAGLGEDINSFEIINKLEDGRLRQFESLTSRKEYTNQVSGRIIKLNSMYHFKKIGIDDGGVGFGVFSELLANSSTRNSTIALNNASRPIDKSEKPKQKRLLKEEMYFNLKNLMEKQMIDLLDDESIKNSLRSIQYEINGETGKTMIFGNDSHITEGIIRACWLAVQDNSLDLFCF